MPLAFKNAVDVLQLPNNINGTTFSKFGTIVGVDYSSTSLSISTGTKTLILDGTNGVDRDYKVDDLVLLTAKTGATGTMLGKVLLYTPNNRGLLVNVNSITGSGTGTLWRITKPMLRVDYHPTLRTVRGVRIEPSATNLFLNSDTALGTVLSGSATQSVVSETAAPDGNMQVRKIVVTATTNYRLGDTTSGVSNTRYTASVFIKTAFDSNMNSVTATVGTDCNDTDSRNWTINSTAYTRVFSTAQTANTFRFLDLNLPVGTYYIWGVQIESGINAPTSYIPTRSTTEVRNTDSINTVNAILTSRLNASEGTVIAKAEHDIQTDNDTDAYSIFSLSDGTANNIISAQLNNQSSASNAARVNIVSAGTNVFSYSTANNVFMPNSTYKVGVTYKANNFYAAFDNVQSPVDTAGAVPSNLSKIFVGSTNGTLDQFRGWIHQVEYYPYQMTFEQLKEEVDSIGNPITLAV